MENIKTGFKQDGEKCRRFILLSTDRRIIKSKEVTVGFLWKYVVNISTVRPR